jgi:soluble lytic murein transglycosylase-like protein
LSPTRSLLLLFLLVGLSVASCSSTLWDRPVAEWKADLALGKTAALLALKPKALGDADLGGLGEGAAWNLGNLFSDAGKTAEAELLWKRSLGGEPSPWREQAGRDLFDLYASRRDWPKAEVIAQKLVGFDGGRAEFRRRLFEAFYFQKKDDQAWEILRSWKPGQFSETEEQENQLFLGVLSARAGKTDEASAILKSLVFDQEASVLQFRLESFFQEDESRYELLGPGGREAVAFQSMVYRGVPKEILAWLKGRKLPGGFWEHRALVEDVATAFKTDARAEAGLRILEGIGAVQSPDTRFALEFARGRLYRALGWWPQARTAFQRALALATSPEDRQKTAWNWLMAWVNVQPAGALGPFLQVLSTAPDPAFYSDVLDAWTTELVQARQWGILAAIWRDLGPKLDPADRATVGFILARLSSHHLVNLGAEGIPFTEEVLLDNMIAVQPYSYEALVARAVLGAPLEWPTQASNDPFVGTDESRAQVRLWESLVAFGQEKRVAAEVADSLAPLDPAFVDRTVPVLQAREQYRPSLQILYRLLKDPGQKLTQDRAMLLYPLAFDTPVTERAQAEGLDVDLFFGLIREESTFDPAARSWVGAQGLTQLMPATAAETAKGLRMKTYDLAVPADNLKIGARYLSTMIRSQGRIYLALMAYNAGGGRIKPWKEAMGKLPEEIFVEAAPLAETRGYVKKILTSAVMTGVLHHDRTLGEMVKLIYPGFVP